MGSHASRAVTCAGCSDVGGRNVNDDAFFHSDLDGLCVVADGIGSHHGEGVASRLAVSTFVEAFESVPGDADRYRVAAALQRIFAEVNHNLYQRFLARDPTLRLGTTLAVLVWRPDGVVTGHVGDSRIYRVRDGAIELLTRDHTFERERTESERRPNAANAPKKFLTRAIGTTPDPLVDVQMREGRPGDWYVLCSDGLTDVAREGDILAACRSEPNAERVAGALVGLALARRTRDNVTVLALHVEC